MVSMRFVSVAIGLGVVFLSSKLSTVAELAIYGLGFAFVVDLFLDLLIADLKKVRKINLLRRDAQKLTKKDE